MSSDLAKSAPQLCGAVHAPPTGPGWVHEIKHDGHRIMAAVECGWSGRSGRQEIWF
jgi:bifunctional non-homologous end joining protein LigD